MHTEKKNVPAFRVELYKGRHRKLWLVTLGFLMITFLWAGSTNSDLSAYEQAQGYTNLFFQLPILNCILMPIMLAVIASRLCDMEIKGQTLKLLYTLEHKKSFYNCKFLHEILYLFLFTLGETLMIPFFGIMFHYTETLSVPLLLRHGICLLMVGTAVLTLQHVLSLMLENQIAPLFIGLTGSFVGLFCSFFPASATRFVLWSYFCSFIPHSMSYDPDSRITTYTPVSFPLVTFILFLIFTILFYIICRTIFLKKEV